MVTVLYMKSYCRGTYYHDISHLPRVKTIELYKFYRVKNSMSNVSQ